MLNLTLEHYLRHIVTPFLLLYQLGEQHFRDHPPPNILNILSSSRKHSCFTTNAGRSLDHNLLSISL